MQTYGTHVVFCVSFTQQRYFVNETFYKPGGPVFLMIGGEGAANPAWMQYGTWLTYAEKLGAICLMLEHRFYGKSHPTRYVGLHVRMQISVSSVRELKNIRIGVTFFSLRNWAVT